MTTKPEPLRCEVHSSEDRLRLAVLDGAQVLFQVEDQIEALCDSQRLDGLRSLLEASPHAGRPVQLEVEEGPIALGALLHATLSAAQASSPVAALQRASPVLVEEQPGPPPAGSPVQEHPSRTRPVVSLAKALNLIERATRLGNKLPPQQVLDQALKHPEATRGIPLEVEGRVQAGLESARALEPLFLASRTHGRAAVEPQLLGFLREFPHLAREAEEQVVLGNRAWSGRVQAAADQHRSRVRDVGRLHQVGLLSPRPRWTLLVDESGTFPEKPRPKDPPGRFVALLVPVPSPLPALAAGWHAVDQSNPVSIDRVVQAVLDAPVGVLGLTVEAVPSGPADRWTAGVLELLAWVLRLLPVAGETTLAIRVEQRGEHNASSWKAALTQLHRELAGLDPEKARQVRLELRLVAKREEPLNGYVDALAFTWGSPAAVSRARLEQSGLLGTCLHEGPLLPRRCWDLLQKGTALDGEEWSRLLLEPDVARPGSPSGILLERLGERCRQEPPLWERYLGRTQQHLDSKAIRLGALGQQLAWLEKAAPPDQTLPLPLRLAWLVSQLENRNHRGETASLLEEELRALCDRLREECPTLVCQAELDLAVLDTNRFDFGAATRRLAPWIGTPPGLPGLLHWGRVQSSLGQHAAFQGDHLAAQAHFDRALQAFARLSDPAQAHREAVQTASYRAISTLETREAPRALLLEHLLAAGVDPARPGPLATSLEPADRYRHHLLLRYLATRGSEADGEAYLACRAEWKEDQGHPWPLIEAYRALLLWPQDREEARLRLEQARALCRGQGPTVGFMGLVLSRVGELLGLPGFQLEEADLNQVRQQLPLAPVEALLRGPRTPLALMEATLPFNFR